MLKLIKKIYHLLRGDYVVINKQITCSVKWYGSNYGGFFLNPDILSEKAVVYSFGIGEDITFDKELINHHQCHVFGFDPTPKSIHWMANQKLPTGFTFYPYGIDEVSGDVKFFLPKNKEHVSGSSIQNRNINSESYISVKMKSFGDIISELNHSRIDVLKMDIEGSEYAILPHILNSKIEIGQILIEFHHRMIQGGKALTMNAIKLLNDAGYEIFAVSESAEEISFIKRELILQLIANEGHDSID